MAALESRFDWGEFDALDLTPYKLIYISYGSMDFLKRTVIQKGEIVETFQNRPFILRTLTGESLSPYLCITIDDYPNVQVVHHKDGMEYTFVQIPSRHVLDLRPITEKLVTMLDKKPKKITIDDAQYPYFLYIANFIKFRNHESGHMDASGKLMNNGMIELEGNRIADYLGTYVSHFYHWIGYNLYTGEDTFPLNLPDWLYKHECIHEKHQLHRLIYLHPDFKASMQKGTLMETVKAKKKDPLLFQRCFFNIGVAGAQQNLFVGGRKRKRKTKKRSKKMI